MAAAEDDDAAGVDVELAAVLELEEDVRMKRQSRNGHNDR